MTKFTHDYEKMMEAAANLRKLIAENQELADTLKTIAEANDLAIKHLYPAELDPEYCGEIVSEIDCSQSTTNNDPELLAFQQEYDKLQERLACRNSGGTYCCDPVSANYIPQPDTTIPKFTWGEVTKDGSCFRGFLMENWLPNFEFFKRGFILDMAEYADSYAADILRAYGVVIGNFWHISVGHDYEVDDYYLSVQVYEDCRYSNPKSKINVKLTWLTELIYGSVLGHKLDRNANPSGTDLFNFVKHVNKVYVNGCYTDVEHLMDRETLGRTAEFVISTLMDQLVRTEFSYRYANNC